MTEIFRDGIESGDFSRWSATSGTPTAVRFNRHHGKFSMLTDATEYVSKNITAITIVFARFYVMFISDVGNNDADRSVIFRFGNDPNGDICDVGRYNDAGTKKWRLRVLESGLIPTYTALSTTPAFELNRWYCIEVKAVIDNVNGEYRVWFDGVENLDFRRLNKDTDDRGSINQAHLGLRSVTGTAPTMHFDCVIISNLYIGPEKRSIMSLQPLGNDKRSHMKFWYNLKPPPIR